MEGFLGGLEDEISFSRGDFFRVPCLSLQRRKKVTLQTPPKGQCLEDEFSFRARPIFRSKMLVLGRG